MFIILKQLNRSQHLQRFFQGLVLERNVANVEIYLIV
jgi:hypothetical protein